MDNYVTIYASSHIKQKIYLRDGFICQYCSRKYKNKNHLIIEHVISTKLGGHARDYNLVVACNSCNMRKKSAIWIPKNIDILKVLNDEWANKIISNAILDSRKINLKNIKRRIKKGFKASSGEWKRKSVIRYSNNENITYVSLAEAAKSNNISVSSISLSIKRGNKAAGYNWRFKS